MQSFLSFTSLGISAGLFIYGREAHIIPLGLEFPIILALIAAGVVIAYAGVRSGKAKSEEDVVKLASEVLKLTKSEVK
jgi:hypothetical protein